MRGEHAARERLERDRVVGIAHDAQPGDHVLDAVVLDQRAAARQPAGNPRSQQSSLEVLEGRLLRAGIPCRLATVSSHYISSYYPAPNAGTANTYTQNYTWTHLAPGNSSRC